jgi:Ca2+-binding EF-hand superfamily protein
MAEFLRLMDVYFDFAACDPRSDLVTVFQLLDRRPPKGLVSIGDIRRMMEEHNMDEKWSDVDSKALFGSYSDEDCINCNEFVTMIVGKK